MSDDDYGRLVLESMGLAVRAVAVLFMTILCLPLCFIPSFEQHWHEKMQGLSAELRAATRTLAAEKRRRKTARGNQP